ncbi:uncharacterized protein LOC106636677 [Copidosoma floridanum]|uniref:uncharacterized protein LOC106636677 n=1 Tax=Copidosoma floridanum TaxID=29053 RepID=UPI0006C9689A|nr:uncharacterized protein LOC106636677 [Copidosoma floridanum]
MFRQTNNIILFTFLCTTIIIPRALSQDCKNIKCKGPIKFYEGINCKPIFGEDDRCCATSYDCSHIYAENSPDKCYMNGHQYGYDEELRDEDKPSHCDVCVCRKTPEGHLDWACSNYNCPTLKPLKKDCWWRHDLTSCCINEEMCPEEGKDIATCKFAKKIYKEGERFEPKGYKCQCLSGFKGDNLSAYCRKVFCGVQLRHSLEIHRNCSPVYTRNQSPVDYCPDQFRCQMENDSVKRKSGGIFGLGILGTKVKSDVKCVFGNLTMDIGDELNLKADRASGQNCVKCTCEVPPTPTCSECALWPFGLR